MPQASADTKAGVGTGDAAYISSGVVCIANARQSMGTECQPNASLAPCCVLRSESERCQMHCKYQTDADTEHPTLTAKSWARRAHHHSSDARFEARSASTRLGGGTHPWHAECHKPALGCPTAAQQAAFRQR